MSGEPQERSSREREVFVGRRSELRLLEESLEQAVSGAGVVLVVSGAAGIGKTALLHEMLRRARENRRELSLLRGRCLGHYGSGEAYLPFLDGLGTLLVGKGRDAVKALLRTYAPTWCLHFPAAMEGLEAPEALREQALGAGPERMIREMGDVFEAASASIPMIGLMEDMQWADPSSLDLIRHLASRIQRQRILIAITVREEDATASKVTSCLQQIRALSYARTFSLGPLLSDDVQAYVDAALDPNDLPPDLAASCFQRTEGNPLFFKKLLAHLVDRGDLSQEGGRWRLTQPISAVERGIPDDLRSMVELKIGSLDEEDVRTLRVASLLGREFASPVLASLLDVDELILEERLDVLARSHGLVRILGEEDLPDGSLATLYRFVQALYQEVLYEGLVSKKKLLLHRSAARELARRYGGDTRGVSAQLALHYEQGRDFSAAASQLLRAAQNAAQLYAHDEAFGYLERALKLIARLPEAERSTLSIEGRQRYASLQVATGHFDQAAETYAIMLAEARAADDVAGEFSALNGACRALFFARRVDEMAVTAYEGSVAAARSGREELRAEALAAVALVLIEDGGRLKESIPLLDEVLEAAGRIDYPAALLPAVTYRGFVHYWQGEYAQAGERLAEGHALAAKLGDDFWLLACQTLRGYASANQGQLSRALSILEAAKLLTERNGDRYWLPRLMSALAYVHRELEDFPTAVSLEREALDLAEQHEDSEATASLRLGLAVTHLRRGEHQAAGAIFEQLTAGPSVVGWLAWNHQLRIQAALAEYHLALGDAEPADTAVSSLLESAEAHGAASYVVMGHAFAAQVAVARGVKASARVHIRAARAGLDAQAAPLTGWRALARLAAVLSELGDRDAANDAWRDASALVSQTAGGIDDPEQRAAFLGSRSVRELRQRAGGDDVPI